MVAAGGIERGIKDIEAFGVKGELIAVGEREHLRDAGVDAIGLVQQEAVAGQEGDAAIAAEAVE